MRPATLVVPMAGRGDRFVEAGFTVPKPMIPVRGRPMYSWAVDSIPRAVVGSVIFVGLAEHLGPGGLEVDIRERYGDLEPTVVGLDGVTAGQVCTVLEVADLLDPDAPLIVYNADTVCRTSLESTLATIGPEVAGVIGVFPAEGDHWSFVRTDDAGRVVETAEKRRISDLATTGLYHFGRAGDFVRAATSMVAEGDTVRGEYYVAPLYNRLIASGSVVLTDPARDVRVLGTPAELEANVGSLR